MSYEKQFRGDAAAYASYYRSMDRSMRQKIALISAYLRPKGVIADMGCGSGQGSYDLARLFPSVKVVGVDISESSIDYARQSYKSTNLEYRLGNVSEQLFPSLSLDAIFNSSVLHHVTSFNQFQIARIHELLDCHVNQLRDGGILAIRDFVAPSETCTVHLDLPNDDGAEEGLVPKLSTAGLFREFALHFRSSVHRHSPVPYQEAASPIPGWRRFTLDVRTAIEFVLRKDYRQDWASELLEEYTYFTAEEFENEYRRRGLKILVSCPIYNPWIVQHRFEDRFYLWNAATGERLPYPPTNYFIIGEKSAPNTGVYLALHKTLPLSLPSYLQVEAARDPQSGQIWEYTRRPVETIDLFPYFYSAGDLKILARSGYPRPILNAVPTAARVERLVSSAYVTEPIAALVKTPDETALKLLLAERAGIRPEAIRALRKGSAYYPSAGGLGERVTPYFIELDEAQLGELKASYAPDFTTTGSIQVLDAAQSLRSFQVGGMLDARLNLAMYEILLHDGVELDPWIGDSLQWSPESKVQIPTTSVPIPDMDVKLETPVPLPQKHFLDHRKAIFHEYNAQGHCLAAAEFEFIMPREHSSNTVSVLPLIKEGNEIYIGMEWRCLPAPQSFTGHSGLWCCPAWRLPQAIDSIETAQSFVRKKMREDFGLVLGRFCRLGGSYAPSNGVTPEWVLPLAAAAEDLDQTKSVLRWEPLSIWLRERSQYADAHLLIAALRVFHALNS